MSLERKDVRFKLDADEHVALSAVAEADERDIGEWVELVIKQELRRRIHAATLIADRVRRSGKAGKAGE